MPDITNGPDGLHGLSRRARVTPAPGIVVAQEIFGVNQVMRDTCDWLAGAGLPSPLSGPLLAHRTRHSASPTRPRRNGTAPSNSSASSTSTSASRT